MKTKRRVLLIEDNANNRYLASFILEQAGLEVLVAKDGRSGVEMARDVRPDLILMDIQMPEMDGYEAARVLLGDRETKDIPIVAATSFAMPGDRARAMGMGFADYIEKPFDPDDFSQRILRLVPRTPDEPT